MYVKANITRTDILRAYTYMQFGLKLNLWSLIIFFILIFTFFYFSLSEHKQVSIFVVAIMALFVTILATVVSLIFGNIIILCTSSEKAGALGKHEFIILSEGLQEKTKANDTLIKWNRIGSVKKTRYFILIQINAFLFHLIPRRSFDDQASYDKFWTELLSYHTAAKKNPQG